MDTSSECSLRPGDPSSDRRMRLVYVRPLRLRILLRMTRVGQGPGWRHCGHVPPPPLAPAPCPEPSSATCHPTEQQTVAPPRLALPLAVADKLVTILI